MLQIVDEERLTDVTKAKRFTNINRVYRFYRHQWDELVY